MPPNGTEHPGPLRENLDDVDKINQACMMCSVWLLTISHCCQSLHLMLCMEFISNFTFFLFPEHLGIDFF